jgi:hypothetical protein
MTHAHRKTNSTSDAITFVSVFKGERGGSSEVAAIRVKDTASFQVEDVLNVSVLGTRAWSAEPMPPLATHESCARALMRILGDATLAAWDVEQVLSDLEEVLGEHSDLLHWDGERPLDIASMARPFLADGDELEDVCDWAGLPHPLAPAAIAEVSAVLAIARRVFEVARLGDAMAHRPDCAFAATH